MCEYLNQAYIYKFDILDNYWIIFYNIFFELNFFTNNNTNNYNKPQQNNYTN
jgi:hypothetical protein